MSCNLINNIDFKLLNSIFNTYDFLLNNEYNKININKIIKEIGMFINSDRSYYYIKNGNYYIQKVEISNKNIKPTSNEFKKIHIYNLPIIDKNNYLYIKTNELQNKKQKIFKKENIKSFLLLPLNNSFLGFDNINVKINDIKINYLLSKVINLINLILKINEKNEEINKIYMNLQNISYEMTKLEKNFGRRCI